MYFIIQNSTPPSQAAEHGNNQPHIVAFTHDDYDQYFIAVEQKLYMECVDLTMAIFLMLGAHYIFNLSYHSRVFDLMKFIQEKIAEINSDGKGKKSKSAVAASHISGLVAAHNALKLVDNHEITEIQDSDDIEDED